MKNNRIVVVMLAIFATSALADGAASAQVVGAWKLVSIEYSGEKGPLTDGVFGLDPHGLIIYDRSGWVSVQLTWERLPGA